jgi:hypothetical protein
MVFSRTLALAVFCAWLVALPVGAQSGLRVPERGEQGLDPPLARGWLAPDYDHFGFAAWRWREPGLGAPSRMQWSYALSERGSLGMSRAYSGELEDQRQYSVFGSYWVSPEWAVSAETLGRDADGLFRLQDIRIGVQRRF